MGFNQHRATTCVRYSHFKRLALRKHHRLQRMYHNTFTNVNSIKLFRHIRELFKAFMSLYSLPFMHINALKEIKYL